MDPFAIPHIAEAIAFHLYVSDLSQCVLVNRSWHAAFTRFLWANIELDHDFAEYLHTAAAALEDEEIKPAESAPPMLHDTHEHQTKTATSKKSPQLRQVALVLNRIKKTVSNRCTKGGSSKDSQPTSPQDKVVFHIEGGNNYKTSEDAGRQLLHPIIPIAAGVKAYGRFIRHIRASVPEDLPIIINYTPYLSTLIITIRNETEWSAISALANNPQIQLSSLDVVASAPLPLRWWESIAALEHLTYFRLVNRKDSFSVDDLIRSVWHCRHLRSLHLVATIRPNTVAADMSAASVTTAASSPLSSDCFTESLLQQIEPLKMLTDLSLRFKDSSDLQDDFFVPFLKLASNVERLFPPLLTRAQAARFADVVQKYCRKIQSIDLTSMLTLTDSDIAAIIKACPHHHLRELLLTDSHVGPETMASIVEHHSGSIEKLAIERTNVPIPSASIQHLLATCSKLKELNAGRQGWTGHVRLEASDIIQSPWACLQLETLAICIAGCTPPLMDAVFEQLAKLTKLKSIDLSEMNNEMQRHVDERGGALQWTLESGMTKLASLTQMEHFWLLSGHFELGERERKWINQHWPNLHKSAGVW